MELLFCEIFMCSDAKPASKKNISVNVLTICGVFRSNAAITARCEIIKKLILMKSNVSLVTKSKTFVQHA